jgi:hypothetical protein
MITGTQLFFPESIVPPYNLTDRDFQKYGDSLKYLVRDVRT